MRHRLSFLAGACVLGALLSSAALAQSPGPYDCAVQVLAGGAFDAHCEPRATDTPAVTATATLTPVVIVTSTPTPTETPTETPTATATSTEIATATSTEISTSTPTPVTAVTGAVANASLLLAPAGDPTLDANNWTIITAGAISPDGGYLQARLAGLRDGLRIYVQVMTPRAAGGFAIQLGDRTQTVTYKATAGWTFGERCGAAGCRGWTASALIPWPELGGLPATGDVWPLVLQGAGGAWAGSLRWGLPDYAGRAVEGAQVLTLPLSADSMAGGGTDCGAQDYPAYFPTWGGRNWGASPYVNVQAQWDVADWPCYSRYFAQWSLAGLPEGAQVVSATVTMRHFGNGGYGDGYADDGTKDTVIQVYEIGADWQEGAISWDSAPALGENVSRTLVRPIDVTCGRAYCNPGIAYAFDVTEIVRRALLDGRDRAGMGLYTAAGQYHSGKYFWSREGGNQAPVVRIAYTIGGTPTWTETPSSTGTPPLPPASLTSTPSATAQSTPTWTETPAPTLTPTPLPTGLPAASPTWTPVVPTIPASETPTPTLTATPTMAAEPSPPTATAPASQANCTRTVGPSDSLAIAVGGLRPGDVLCLADGVYAQSIAPRINGTATQPITIRAVNDGGATIDGQGVRKPLNLGEGTGGGNWFVIDGLVLRNGTEHVAIVRGNNNVLRRVSIYDADTDANSQPLLLWGDDNLVEDCIVGGTGRFMIDMFQSSGNTVRRCFVKWSGWDGKNFCGIAWGGVFGLGIYNSSNGTLENNIVYGKSMNNFVVQANHTDASANNNRILGNISVLAGKDYDGSLWHFGSPTWPKLTRPQPTVNPYGAPCDTAVVDLAWPGQRIGMQLFGQGVLSNNIFRDNLIADSAGLGFGIHNPGGGRYSSNVFDRFTLLDNGSDAPSADGGKGSQIRLLSGMTAGSITGTCISPQPPGWTQSAGADVSRQYKDGIKTDALLLPWPMQNRALAETGVDVTAMAQGYIDRAVAECR